jgi:hypothetical protein
MGGNTVRILDEDEAGCGVTDNDGSAYPMFPVGVAASAASPQLPAAAAAVVEPGAPFASVTKYPPVVDEDGFGGNTLPG